MGLFSRDRVVEKQLEETYTTYSMVTRGQPAAQARALARQLLAQAKQQSREDGTDRYPSNYGELMRAGEKTDPRVREILAERRREGVTDADIRWWWNLHDLERHIMLQLDDLDKTAVAIYKTEQGASPEDASAEALRTFPRYGYAAAADPAGENRLLELKDRVNRWLVKLAHDPVGWRERLTQFSSVNALIRSEIRAGRL